MDTKKYLSHTIKLSLLVLAIGNLGACSKKSSSSSGSTTTVTPTDDTGDDTNDELTRRCRIPVRFTDSAAHVDALEALVQATVERRERPTTMCIAAEASPLKRFGASLRFEYEDNFGLRWVTFRKKDLIYSSRESSKFRITYLDMYGYVDVKATRNSSGQYVGTARLANVDSSTSYLDQIEEFLSYIRKTCNESPTKCMNPIFISDPTSSRPPTEAELLKRADEALAGLHGADAFTLGTVSFKASDIESTLF